MRKQMLDPVGVNASLIWAFVCICVLKCIQKQWKQLKTNITNGKCNNKRKTRRKMKRNGEEEMLTYKNSWMLEWQRYRIRNDGIRNNGAVKTRREEKKAKMKEKKWRRYRLEEQNEAKRLILTSMLIGPNKSVVFRSGRDPTTPTDWPTNRQTHSPTIVTRSTSAARDFRHGNHVIRRCSSVDHHRFFSSTASSSSCSFAFRLHLITNVLFIFSFCFFFKYSFLFHFLSLYLSVCSLFLRFS